MDKRVDEMADSVKNETVNDLLSLFNTNYKTNSNETTPWDYNIVEDIITQPLLITTASNPIILHRNGETYFSFDGRTLFFDKTYKNFYVFLPFTIRDACFYNLKKKSSSGSKSVIITLDNQNKLSYSTFKNHSINETKVMISRNVLQMVEKNKEIYYLSFKKDHYFLNIVAEDNGILKAKIVIQNLTSKYSMYIFWTSKNIFIYQDRNIISSTGKKLKTKGDGIYEISNMFVIYNKTKSGVLLSLCDDNFVIKNELTIENTNHVIKIVTVYKMICCRIGYKIYFIDVFKNELVIVKEIECPDNLLDFSVRSGDNKKILLCFLLQTKVQNKDTKHELNEAKDVKESNSVGADEVTIIENPAQDFETSTLSDFQSLLKKTSFENFKDHNNLSNDSVTNNTERFSLPRPEVDSKVYNPFIEYNVYKDDNNFAGWNNKSDPALNLEKNGSSPFNHENGEFVSCMFEAPNFSNESMRTSKINSDNALPKFTPDNLQVDFPKFNSGTVNTDFTSFGRKYNSPLLSRNNTSIEETVLKLFECFEKKLDERDKVMKENQLLLLEKLSDGFTSSLLSAMEKVVRSELEVVQQNIINVMTSKFSNLSKKDVDDERLLEFTREVICDNLLPVVEASMEEMRIQVVSEVSNFKNSDYLQDVKSALANLSFNGVMSDIEKAVRSNNIDKAIEYVIGGNLKDMEELLRFIDPEQLEVVSSKNLIGFLEKFILLGRDVSNKKFDDFVYNTLTFIELDSLDEDELRALIIVLSQIKDSELFNSESNKQIIVLVDFLKFKIPKILFKRQKSLKY